MCTGIPSRSRMFVFTRNANIIWQRSKINCRRIARRTIIYCKKLNLPNDIKMTPDSERIPIIEGKLSLRTKLAYALGHIFNDLAAAMWFSYTLIYLQRIVLLEPLIAGALLLLGQLVDALMTPVFGVLIDRYTKKKIWHIMGSILVALSFPIIFGSFFNKLSGISMAMYIVSIIIFQTGWAAVQISHLSMIPMLTNLPLARAELTAIRYSAQVAAAVFVFVITWIILPADENAMVRLTEQDSHRFRNIVLIVTACGITATILFHVFLKGHLLEINTLIAKKINREASTSNANSNENNTTLPISITLLLRVALLYVASRLFITLATVYLPLYIEETDVGGKQALATVPLTSYLASLVAALMLKYINKSCGTKMCYLLGAVIGTAAAGFTEFGGTYKSVIYVIAILIGAASSITMVTALSVTAEFIGLRTENSALVYSIVTFLDKVVTGLVVVLIEKWRCTDEALCPTYNRDSLAIVCAASMILGLITLLTITHYN